MPEIGDKYVIEIDTVYSDHDYQLLYGIKGFRSLVFDEYGLSKLNRVHEEINASQKYGDCEKCANLFGSFGCMSTVDNKPVYNCREGMSKYEIEAAYERGYSDATDKILSDWGIAPGALQVGDEVIFTDGSKGVVVKKILCGDADHMYRVLWSSGDTGDYFLVDEIKPTGKHYPVPDILKEMEDDSEHE